MFYSVQHCLFYKTDGLCLKKKRYCIIRTCVYLMKHLYNSHDGENK